MLNFILHKKQLHLHSDMPTIHLVRYESDVYSEKHFTQYEIEKPVSLDTWHIKRKAQFLAGRIAVQSAFKFINLPAIEIKQGKSNEPIWPSHLSGSISHQNQFSIACLCKTKQKKTIQGIGIDIQAILNDKEIDNCKAVVLTKKDKVILKQNIEKLTKQQLVTLFFSAKESFYKASFKTVATIFDFDAVSIHAIDHAKQQLTLISETPLSLHIKKGDLHVVSYCFESLENMNVVISYCEIA